MSLRQRTLYFIGAIAICSLIEAYFLFRLIIIRPFNRLEAQATRDKVAQAVGALDAELGRLDTAANDWAAWDDTYAFVRDDNAAYRAANLTPNAFEMLSIDLLAIVDEEGRATYGGAYDLAARQHAAPPAAFSASLDPADPLLRYPGLDAGTAGLLDLPEGLLLVASRPILTSDRQGPARGALIMGRYLDEVMVAQLAQTTHLALDVVPVASIAPDSDLGAALILLTRDDPVLTRTIDRETIAGYTLLNDLDGRPVAALSVAAPRALYAQGLETSWYMLATFVAIMAFNTFIYLFWLDERVVSRLTLMSNEVRQISRGQSASQRLTVPPGRDELATLALAINSSLDDLDRADVERRRISESLAHSEENYRQLFENSPVSLWEEDFSAVKVHLDELRAAGVGDLRAHLTAHPEAAAHCAGLIRVVNVNQAALRMNGVADKAELVGKVSQVIGEAAQSAMFIGQLLAIAEGETDYDADGENTTLAGEVRDVAVKWSVVPGYEETLSRVLVSIIDNTERRRLQEQLLQAQKMESVGRLAGGVAHDFNNMLQVILGHSDMALAEVCPGTPLHDDLQQIQASAQRSADLTRQLLAFARKQTIRPQVLDLNELVVGMLKMLQRLAGENIQFVWKPGSRLWSIKIDPSQVDQVLANLVVNARDAIGDVGVLTITTENVVLDEVYRQAHAECVPGRYVQLAVSDTGAGMSKAVIARIFEPFFTTKGVGQGTGLGLPTVYGIVQQNGGWINVYSEPGRGTTFRIYLPAEDGPSASPAIAPAEPYARGHEVVLLVEDEPSVLALARAALERAGYTVVAADGPKEALAVLEQYAGPLDLLITDVVMPEMNGRELLRKVEILRPGIKALFMSGYTADVIAHHGVLEDGVEFLEKPFSRHTLSATVRRVLDEEPGDGVHALLAGD